MTELKGQPLRQKRSINWIGSAWKWIAGNPDAADWDQIIRSQNQIVKNNNQQYKVNDMLMKTAHQIVQEYNKIMDHLGENSTEELLQAWFNRLSIVKEEIKEIVRAVQLAKSGTINSNLLDKKEISRIVAEIETLPYTNEIEAIEYVKPTVIVKDSTILYIVSMPKTSSNEYNHLAIRSAIENKKRIYLEYEEVLVNQAELFGISEKCSVFKDIVICKNNQLFELQRNHCINQLLRGQRAQCEYQFDANEEVESLTENTIFLNNFKGQITYNHTVKTLQGNFLLELYNETIRINNDTYTTTEIRTSQVLPTVLQHDIVEKGTKLDLKHLHSLHLSNVEKLGELFTNHQASTYTNISIVAVIIMGLIIIYVRKSRHHQEVVFVPNVSTQPMTASDIHGIQPISLNF